jgi:hypothetical protein
MLWSMAFDRIGVVVGDLFFLDPEPDAGQEGPERGVRLELRMFEREPLQGAIYSAVPIRIARPLWRVDLLESVASPLGCLDRAHHHPRFAGWDPGSRVFVPELRDDPVGWLRGRFAAVSAVLDDAAAPPGSVPASDAEHLAAAGPAVVAVVEQLLADMVAGRCALAPAETGESIRSGWL